MKNALSRREFMQMLGLLGAGAVLTSCRPIMQQHTPSESSIPHWLQEYNFSGGIELSGLEWKAVLDGSPALNQACRVKSKLDKSVQPLFNANSLVVFNALGRYGGAGLVKDVRGTYAFLTVEHVIRELAEQGEPIAVFIPGHGNFDDRGGSILQLPGDTTAYFGTEVRDEYALLPLDSQSIHELEQLEGLTISTFNFDQNRVQPQPGQVVMIPNPKTGLLTHYSFVGQIDGYHEISTNGNAGVACEGRSGTPAFFVDATGNPKLLGVVKGGLVDPQSPNVARNGFGQVCYDSIILTPVPPLA